MKEKTEDHKELGKCSLAESIPDLTQIKEREKEEKDIQTWISNFAFKAFSHLAALNHLHSILDLHKLVSFLGVKNVI